MYQTQPEMIIGFVFGLIAVGVFVAAHITWMVKNDFIDDPYGVFYELQWRLRRLKEYLRWRIARMVPRWLVYDCAIRLIAHGTTGKFGSTNTAEVRAITVLKRWGEKN